MTLRDDPRLTAFGLLAEAYDGLAAKLEVQLAEHDTRPLEFDVIVRLGRTPGARLRMTDLAAQTRVTTSGVTRVVDRLEHDGLVRRVACPTDRRGFFAELTPAGHARLDAILPDHVALIDEWFVGRLGRTELDAVLHGLRVVRDGVRPDATAGADGTDSDGWDEGADGSSER